METKRKRASRSIFQQTKIEQARLKNPSHACTNLDAKFDLQDAPKMR